jgi:hypothetical protein
LVTKIFSLSNKRSDADQLSNRYNLSDRFHAI